MEYNEQHNWLSKTDPQTEKHGSDQHISEGKNGRVKGKGEKSTKDSVYMRISLTNGHRRQVDEGMSESVGDGRG